MTPLFRKKAHPLMRQLMRDFGFTSLDAAAIIGNAGHESLGFAKLQEMKPVVKGSRGGYGFFQWTGPRRKAFEAWCAGKGLSPSSDEGNYGFLVHELLTSESKAVNATKKAAGLQAKVIAFENAFERSGVKAYDKRLAWAREALAAYDAAEKALKPPIPPDAPPPDDEPFGDVPAPPRAGFFHALAAWVRRLFTGE